MRVPTLLFPHPHLSTWRQGGGGTKGHKDLERVSATDVRTKDGHQIRLVMTHPQVMYGRRQQAIIGGDG